MLHKMRGLLRGLGRFSGGAVSLSNGMLSSLLQGMMLFDWFLELLTLFGDSLLPCSVCGFNQIVGHIELLLGAFSLRTRGGVDQTLGLELLGMTFLCIDGRLHQRLTFLIKHLIENVVLVHHV